MMQQTMIQNGDSILEVELIKAIYLVDSLLLNPGDFTTRVEASKRIRREESFYE